MDNTFKKRASEGEAPDDVSSQIQVAPMKKQDSCKISSYSQDIVKYDDIEAL